jgi:HEAT repeat protein
MARLAARGCAAKSLNELTERYAPLPEPLADALVDLLPSVDHPNVREGVVRALGARRTGFNVRPLLVLLEQTPSDSLRWAIANTLAEARPSDVASWVLQAVQDVRYGKAREMLALAAARTSAPAAANPVLVRLLAELPGHAALGLAESGTPKERPALRRAREQASGWEREQIGRTIDIITRRRQERR